MKPSHAYACDGIIQGPPVRAPDFAGAPSGYELDRMTDEGKAAGDVFFEFTAIGRSVKVVAIHGASGTEVTVVGPASASRADLQRLALRKLQVRMQGGLPP